MRELVKFLVASFVLLRVVAVASAWELEKAGSPLSVVGTFQTPSSVHAFAFSPDGRWLFSAGDEATDMASFVVTCWDVGSKKVKWKRDAGNRRQIVELACSPCGKLLAVADYDGEISILNAEGKRINAFRHFERSSTLVTSLKFGDDEHVLSSAFHAVAQKWNVRTNRTSVYRLDPAQGLIYAADITPGAAFFAWTDGFTLNIHGDGISKGCGFIRFGRKIEAERCAISHDGAVVMIASEKGMLHLFDTSKKALIKQWKGHAEALTVHRVIAIPSLNAFATADAGGHMNVWDRSGNLLAHVQHDKSAVTGLAASPDDSILVSSANDRIVFWSWKTLPR